MQMEKMLSTWEIFTELKPDVREMIQPGLRKGIKYYQLMDDTSAYVIAMGMFCPVLCSQTLRLTNILAHKVINPYLKLEHIAVNWDESYQQTARRLVLRTVRHQSPHSALCSC